MDKAHPTLSQTAELSRDAATCALSLQGGPLGSPVPLPRRRVFRLGSRHDCDLQLLDPAVSSLHASFQWNEDHYIVCDLSSTNGTWLDGVRVTRARVYPGARVVVGRTCFELQPRSRRAETRTFPPHPIVGKSRRLHTALSDLHKLAQLRLPVLLRGETGTGKELFARTLHDWGARAQLAFVEINCAAIPDQLAESELFGHVRGAFTGAHRNHAGAFTRAHEGTLFLDEVAELPLVLQAKLLRVLETGQLQVVGEDQTRQVDVRLVAATHRDLERMVQERLFREDLYHRISVVELQLPALRERREDIPLLAQHFAQQISEEMQRPVRLSRDALDAAQSAPWPGNVRALRNAVLRAAALSEGPITASTILPQPGRDAGVGGDLIEVPRGSFAHMKLALVERVVAEEGSIRRAARVLDVPRSTLGAWLKR